MQIEPEPEQETCGCWTLLTEACAPQLRAPSQAGSQRCGGSHKEGAPPAALLQGWQVRTRQVALPQVLQHLLQFQLSFC
jgi:hypothetical protein